MKTQKKPSTSQGSFTVVAASALARRCARMCVLHELSMMQWRPEGAVCQPVSRKRTQQLAVVRVGGMNEAGYVHKCVLRGVGSEHNNKSTDSNDFESQGE